MALQENLDQRLRLLRLETLYDLALDLHAQRPEAELVEELLQRVCAVLDPEAAVAVTRAADGEARAAATVGWAEAPSATRLLRSSIWQELLLAGGALRRTDGELAGRPFGELLAAPLAARGVFLGYLAVLDRETRGEGESAFDQEDRRYLESVAALAAVTLESARQVEDLAADRERLAEENRALRGELEGKVGQRRIVAHSPEMRQVLERAARVAPRGVTVLVRGESGTGKELLARFIHLESGRTGALVALNCVALPESLLESELFGIEAGVATGVDARRGKFELADGGTLFLDEIGDLDPALQVRLLRALQEREVVRVGGEQPIRVDVRLIAATHRDLESLVSEGGFREDLYYRLKGVEIELPPLAERRDDIPHLVRAFVADFCRREGIAAPSFSSEALGLLFQHDWPGNVRELQNAVEAAVSLAGDRVEARVIASLLGRTDRSEPQPLDLETLERRHIGRVLQMVGGNKSQAARILGIDRRTLQRRGF